MKKVNKIIRKTWKKVKNRKDQKIILENWGQPGPEAICTQAAALRYAIRVHLEHLNQFKRQKINEGVSTEKSLMSDFREWKYLHRLKTPTNGS